MIQIGDPTVRITGKAKVTGAAKFSYEFEVPNMVYGHMILSTVPSGRIAHMDSSEASQVAGVLHVMTPANAPRLPNGGKNAIHPPAGRNLQLLQDNQVHYNNQPIAYVVAERLEQAIYAASLIKVRYQSAPAKLDFPENFAEAHPGGHNADPPDMYTGDFDKGIAEAEVKLDEVYTTPKQNHNPMEPHATIAEWEGDKLTLHDATQYVSGVKQTLAKAMGLPEDNVRVICPFTGGGFGCKGSTWSHVVLTAMAAKVVGRPVKLALERPQMFGPVGGRPQTWQHIVLGAKRDGTLTAVRHDCYSHTSVIEDFTEPSSVQTRMLYASPNITTSQRLVPLNVGTPTFQRAPGESTGTFALEIAMDELAYKLQMDPIALRLKNYAEVDPTSKKKFTSKHLRACYEQGAQKFGWGKRNPEPRTTRDGRYFVGWGMATATYPANRAPAMCLVRLLPDGHVLVASGTQDLGTGMYTVMAQVAAATLKLPMDRIDAKLGDTEYPKAPVSGGSMSSASVTPAVQAACQQVILKLLTLATRDEESPFHNAQPDELEFTDGQVVAKKNHARAESYLDLIARNGHQPIEATASAQPDNSAEQYSAHSFGAVFAEVAVDESIGMPRVRRVVAVYDIGTLLNEKTGHSQLIGGIVWGVSLALAEVTHIDPRYGRAVNNNLAEYHVPVNLDIGAIEVSTIGIPDKVFNPVGARGIGEIGITGSGAAVANAIYHATGKRIRKAPITPDMLMA
ncbi:MAG: xanthine dehydrogenase family protein molybdopterin-binding subunit [Acidobacteriaceae bacterium]